jgi:hypothetical protein
MDVRSQPIEKGFPDAITGGSQALRRTKSEFSSAPAATDDAQLALPIHAIACS